MKMNGSDLEEIHLLKCWGWLSLLNWIQALILPLLLKLPPRKLEPWFVLWSFFLLWSLCISINLQYGHAWSTVVMFGLVLLGATWNCRISYKNGYEGLSLAASLEPLAHCQNKARWSLFYRYHFGRCLSELDQLVPLPYSRGKSTCYPDILHDFSVIIPRCYKGVYSFVPNWRMRGGGCRIKCTRGRIIKIS